METFRGSRQIIFILFLLPINRLEKENIYLNSLDPPPPLFKGVGVNFNYLPWREGSEKLKTGGGSMIQGQIFLKWRTDTFPI